MQTTRPPKLESGRSHDVIVVGSRAAGAATAMLLARRSIRVLLLDHGPPGADTLSTHALLRGGVAQLARWGLLDEIVAAGTPPVRRTTYRYGDESLTITMKAAHGVDALYAPRRTLLDSLLRARRRRRRRRRAPPHLRDRPDRDRRAGDRASAPWPPTAARRPRRPAGHRRRRRPLDGRPAGAARPSPGSAATPAPPPTATGRASTSDGYEWNFRPDACSGVIPTNDGQACVVAMRLAAAHRPGRPGPARRGRRRGRTGPGGSAGAAAGAAAPHDPDVGRPARLPPPVPRSRLGAGRRRRLLQRSDQPARPDRRTARRRAAGRRRRGDGLAGRRSAPRRGARRLRGHAGPAQPAALRRRRPHRQPALGRSPRSPSCWPAPAPPARTRSRPRPASWELPEVA